MVFKRYFFILKRDTLYIIIIIILDPNHTFDSYFLQGNMFIAAATAANTKSTKFTSICLLVIVTVLILDKCMIVEARYLPTRSNGDRIDKLRELLKDVSIKYKIM